MCYSYGDRQMEEARRKQWEKEERKRREQQKKERQAKKDRELVKAYRKGPPKLHDHGPRTAVRGLCRKVLGKEFGDGRS